MIRKLLLLLALLAPASAHAQWREAVSGNFVVYSEGSERELREFTERLEKFDYVLRVYHGVTEPPSPNRLRVFLMPSTNAVGRLAGSRSVAGYYIPRARAQLMVGIRSQPSRAATRHEQVLLHEYTHHFMYQYFPATYPTWYSEGFAEFWGATKILDDDVVEVGLPVDDRYGSFFQNRWMPLDRLLTAQSYSDVGRDIDLLYAQGWVIMRYVFENEERRAQLDAYLNAINRGRTYRDAMNEAFPDVARLNREVQNFARQIRMQVVRLPFREIPVGDIAIRTLPPAENAMLMHELRISQGVRASEAAQFAATVRREAAAHGDAPAALRVLAEAEWMAEEVDNARRSVERLLAAAPGDPAGLVLQARLDLDRLAGQGETDAQAWTRARRPIIAANTARPNDPVILEAYYDSFRAQGVMPPADAQNALYMAMELAPSDGRLRHKLAQDFEQRGMIPEAIAIIRSEAYRMPHDEEELSEREQERRDAALERGRLAGTTRVETPREMLNRLEARLAEDGGASPEGDGDTDEDAS